MSAGIDKEFVRDFYQRMTDEEVIQTVKQGLTGLTVEAKEVITKEIKRRSLDVDISKMIESEQEEYPIPDRVFDAESCPVDEHIRIWLESSFLALLSLFGKDMTQSRKVLTPEPKYFPVRYDGGEDSAFETLGIIANQMEVSVDRITLDFYDENLRNITEGNPGGLYWGKGGNDNFEISLARTILDEPEKMIAVLAHEIAHIKLLGENRMEENDERITDLTTIFFGLGIFNANVAFQTFADAKYHGWSQIGYLTQMEWGYALSLFAYIRQEQHPEWADYLCKNVKADFIQGQNFIENNEDLIFQPG